jgi:hypothetical protein
MNQLKPRRQQHRFVIAHCKMKTDSIDKKIRQLIDISWTGYKNKVASNLILPDDEKTMQLQLAQIIQTLIPIFEHRQGETIKVSLEVPVIIDRPKTRRNIDIVIVHTEKEKSTFFPIELKCFRQYTKYGRTAKDKKRGAEPICMYNYWLDIENIECYSSLDNYSFCTQLTLTDHAYIVTGRHEGLQVSPFSTKNTRRKVTGHLESNYGQVMLSGQYDMTCWENIGDFYFIRQENNNAL